MWKSIARLAAALVTLLGCGGDDVPAVDAGARDAAVDASASRGPNIPWLVDGVPPIEWPCPAGWREIAVDGARACDPYPESGPSACGPGEGHFPGEPDCRPVGDPCAPGDFAVGLPADGTVRYVLAGAPAGGDGSMSAPFAQLGEVPWTAITSGMTVALSKGSHAGTVRLHGGARVVGACAAETLVVALPVSSAAAVTVISPGEPAVVRNVTIADAPYPGVGLRSDRAIRLEGVVIERVRDGGVLADGARTTVELEDVVIRDVAPLPDGSWGRGMTLQSGVTARATRVVLERNHDIALFVHGAEVVLADAAIRSTAVTASPSSAGRGIVAQEGAVVHAERLAMSDDGATAILASMSSLVVSDVVVRDSSDRRGAPARAVFSQEGSTITLARALVERSHGIALAAVHPGSQLFASDVIVSDTRQRPEGAEGRAVHAQGGARVTIDRGLLSRSREVAIAAHEPGAEIHLSDVLVQDVAPRFTDDALGHGAHAQDGGLIDGSRVVISRTRSNGLIAVGGTVAMTDVVVDDVRVAACAASTCPERVYGYGVVAALATIRLERFVVSNAETCGVMIAEPPVSLDLVSGVVSGAAIGACVQVDGYDVGRLSNGVEYRDNGENLQSTSLPVPSAIDSM